MLCSVIIHRTEIMTELVCSVDIQNWDCPGTTFFKKNCGVVGFVGICWEKSWLKKVWPGFGGYFGIGWDLSGFRPAPNFCR